MRRLIAVGDVQGIIGLLSDTTLSKEVRIGLVEALGAIDSDDALQALADFAGKAQDESLRKSAFRLLRRSRRSALKRRALQSN